MAGRIAEIAGHGKKMAAQNKALGVKVLYASFIPHKFASAKVIYRPNYILNIIENVCIFPLTLQIALINFAFVINLNIVYLSCYFGNG